jgi:uncharacterized protein YbjT (DUF2867 family)
MRRPGALPPGTGARELVFDYDEAASYQRLGTEIPCDVLLCCLGTTMKNAGSPEAFLKVDRDYPLALLARAAALPRPPVFGLVSSVGADRARGVYLGAKAAVEKAVRESGLAAVIVRPSLLDGDRAEFRAAERIGLAVGRPLFALLAAATGRAAWVGRFAPIAVSTVAAALVRETLRLAASRSAVAGAARLPVVVQEGWELRAAAES